tara:strand:- start:178 stop:462 length:285 start_codon:yes stop_codon:yes gene_type:complete
MTDLKRPSYTVKAQKAYYLRVKADPLKHREYLDRINKKRKEKKDKKAEEERVLKEVKDAENNIKLDMIKLLIENNKNCVIKIENGSIVLSNDRD